MEHNPYISLSDKTEITYSDLKFKKNGEEYITVYFETPTLDRGFCSMDIEYPHGFPSYIVGYTAHEINSLLDHYNKVAKLAFNDAKEDFPNT